jgi:hypothetical protein
MTRIQLFNHCILSMVILAFVCSCSESETVTPQIHDSLEFPSFLISQTIDNPKDHFLMGVWEVDFDIQSESCVISSTRESATHYQVTELIPAPQIEYNYLFDNVLDIDVTISNPYPINVYDVRIIIYSDSSGHMLANADSWTPLYDIPGGLPINSFKSFSRDDPNRMFSSRTEQTVNLQITTPGNNYSILFALEASYPGNCEEPYEISDFDQDVLYEQTGSATDAVVNVLDWQNDTSAVYFYCQDITGVDIVPLFQVTQDSWEFEIVNEAGADAGSYTGFILAFSNDSGNIFSANRVIVHISDSQAQGWARSWGGESYDKALCVTVDSQNDTITGGIFFNVVDFDPGPGTDLHSSNGEDDIFLCKYDEAGKLKWAKTWGSIYRDRNGYSGWSPDVEYEDPVRGIIVDVNDNIYVTGSFQNTVDFDPGAGVFELMSNGGCDIYLAKFSKDGNFIWAVNWGGQRTENLHESGCDLVIDSAQNIIVTGCFNSSADFDPGPEQDWHVSPAGGIFLSKFDNNGNYLWAETWGTNSFKDSGNCVAIDTTDNIFVGGKFKGANVDFAPREGVDLHTSTGSCDAFLSKFHSGGGFYWAKTWSEAYGDNVSDVVTDNSDNIYATGHFDGEGDFDPGPGEVFFKSNGSADSLFSKFDTDGYLIWALSWGSMGNDRSESMTIETNSSQYLYITTTFSSNIDLDPGSGEDIHNSFWNNGFDTAVSKFDLDGNYIAGRSWGGEYDIYFCDVCLDNDRNIVLTGAFNYEIDFDPGSNIENHISNGESDAFLIKLLPNGYWE